MLKRLALRDFVIVTELEVEFDAGFSVLTGETGAGKSILIDALQLALGSRGDVGLVREGCTRAEVSAEFEDLPLGLQPWLEAAGFDAADSLLLRRTIDAQGKSRAWINGSPATVGQLREAADHLVEIHGQHAWQRLTRAGDARALLDAQAGVDPSRIAQLHARWKDASAALQRAREQGDEIERERERLAWQIHELDRLAPGDCEWDELNAEHSRLSHAQALIEAARSALDGLSQADGSAIEQTDRALAALQPVARYDAALMPMIDVLQGAQAQLADAAHSLHAYLDRDRADASRLVELDARLSAWHGLARRLRRPASELPALLAQWKGELQALEAALDVSALEAAVSQAEHDYRHDAEQLTALRQHAADALARAVTQAMQGLGMVGGRFDVALLPQPQPQSFGLENVEFQVAGHAGATPRALAKVASGGELSRLALAIAVTTSRARPELSSGAQAGGNVTLIFDEIDAGIGGTVGDVVGALMKQLGQSAQVLAVTHLAQVAACGDQHWVVRKSQTAGRAHSDLQRVTGETRVAEIARMLGGERMSGTAHAQALLQGAAAPSDALGERLAPPRARQGQRPKGAPMSTQLPATQPTREVVLVTGISGSGKSVALHALEDAGYFCVDNLPPELLREFVRLEHARDTHRVAVAVDVRAARSLPALVPLMDEMRGEGVLMRSLFLDATTDALVRRFSETRRPHPLANPMANDNQTALVEAIELERLLLGELREVSTVIDTSQLRPADLRGWVRRLVQARHAALTLVFESFAFKFGVPLDADFVFDVRVLPNPYYIRELRALTGSDPPVADYLRAQPESEEMLTQIEAFLRRWLPSFEADQRSYLTVAIGCTGGQHRSVYIVEQLAQRFADFGAALVRHRELDASD